MLELGQFVDITTTPMHGSMYFDEDDLYERDYVCGIRFDEYGDVIYQLADQDEDCWWEEVELDESYGKHDDNIPTYELGDEVTEADDPHDVKVITGIYLVYGDFMYQLDNEETYIDECDLTLHRKKDDTTLDYTLF